MSHTRDAAQIAYLDEMRDWVTNTQARVVRGDTSFVPTLRTRLRKQAALEAAVGDHAAVPALLSRAAECGVTLLRCASAPGAKVRFSLGGQSISGTAAVSPDQADRVVWIETFWFTHLVDDPRLRAELLALPLELALSDRVQEPPHYRPYLEALVELELSGRVRQDLVRAAIEATGPPAVHEDAELADYLLFVAVPVLKLLHLVGAGPRESFVPALEEAADRHRRYATWPGRLDGFEPWIAWEASGVAALMRDRGAPVPRGMPHLYP